MDFKKDAFTFMENSINYQSVSLEPDYDCIQSFICLLTETGRVPIKPPGHEGALQTFLLPGSTGQTRKK